ncbi:FAD-dependent oxidoreductase [Mycobacterium sp. OTB74]|uniref:FAD-dependent oxidoreductase n=1 Tax=Mycobacterium sp. OTB74 TaxID=1853452 RepID=UPI0024742723|nr:FAD-dependent oxidoreductase [Mycobacterium sp. OTB74]MDH6245665.1 2-polyprenyl-6-methoxyphenol hydroxylase-like FAD-dependent oxidoreductase [Mycobacterium sp. OTB74]
MDQWKTTCLVVGGGPAGMMLGYLLARSGVQTIVAEKHGDFFRDFRGDTVHPSTTELLDELGLLDEFLTQVPHQKVQQLGIGFKGQTFDLIDFRHLPTACKYVAFMPQWDFLNFLAAQAARYPSFRLEMDTEATGLLRQGDRITGVTAQTPGGPVEIHADVTVACDGRWSIVRDQSGLPLKEFRMPIDVLWFRLPHGESAPEALGYLGAGQIILAINRGDYWQCGAIIEKGAFERVRAEGLAAFRSKVAAVAPFLATSLNALTDWEQVRLLSVRANRLQRWWLPGLLCIGDAAHAMSPVGGIGVNYAIADAVAAANALARPLREGQVSDHDLRAAQRRRNPPTRLAQFLQGAQTANLARMSKVDPPLWMLRLLSRSSLIKRMLGRIMGLGFRREHIHTSEQPAK